MAGMLRAVQLFAGQLSYFRFGLARSVPVGRVAVRAYFSPKVLISQHRLCIHMEVSMAAAMYYLFASSQNPRSFHSVHVFFLK